jgi:hypothetical protein
MEFNEDENLEETTQLDVTQEALVDTLRDYGYSYQQAIDSLISTQWNIDQALNQLLTAIPSSPPELTTNLSSDSQEKLEIYHAIYGEISTKARDILVSIGVGYRQGYLSAEQRAALKYDLLNGTDLNMIQSQIRRLAADSNSLITDPAALERRPSRNYLAPREGIQLQKHLSSSYQSTAVSDEAAETGRDDPEILQQCPLENSFEQSPCLPLAPPLASSAPVPPPPFVPSDSTHDPQQSTGAGYHSLLQRRVEITDQDQEYEESLANDRLKFLRKYSQKLSNYSLICRRYQIASDYRQWKDESSQHFKAATAARRSPATAAAAAGDEAQYLRISIQFPKENSLFPFPTSVPFSSSQHLLKMQGLFAQHTPTTATANKEIFYFKAIDLLPSSPPLPGQGQGEEREGGEQSQAAHFYSVIDSKIQEFVNERWVKQIEILPVNLFQISATKLKPEFVLESDKYLTSVMNQQGDQSSHFYSNEEMELYRKVLKVSSQVSDSSCRQEITSGLSYTISLVYPRTPLYRMENGQMTILLQPPAPHISSSSSAAVFGIDPRGDNLSIEDLQCSWNSVFGYDYNRAEF